MTRYHATSKGRIPFTPEEEARWDVREAKEAERKAQAAEVARVTAIKADLAANDAKIIRAITEGDEARVKAHKAAQATLRTKLK